ncbi:hypothetical protein T484DRAFT_1828401 [Baffinella frigidus]|nr:hypothetical protein T484DRAFT_1828401 [Cryptophyta sp. CCMP2293]
MVLPRPGTLGIVRECYSKWERRAPLTPSNVAQLVKVLHQPKEGTLSVEQLRDPSL